MRERGFTLVELTISVLVVGILMVGLSPVFTSLVASQKRVYDAEAKWEDRAIGQAFLSYAATSTTLGTLPAGYTGSGYTRTIYNPSDSSAAGLALAQVLAQSGVAANSINDDGTAAANVRVFQLVTGLTHQVPLYFQSGPVVTLTYQFGAIYMTSCPKSQASCNPNSATGVPGTSVALTGANYSTWKTSGTDLPHYPVSTLPLQKSMLVTTVQRLDKVRDKLLEYFRSAQITAAAGDATNWYPAGSTSLSGQTPATNQGCRDGWYSLRTTNVLDYVGLSPTEFGITAWGGPIEYCRDYDPTGTNGANTSPHYAALRIHGAVSTGVAPSSSVTGNNVVLTF